jgi:hypothetical protein
MYKHLLLALALLSAVPIAHAQVRFGIGPQVGYTLSSADYKYNSYTNDSNYRSGFSAGLTGEFGIGHLAIRPAVLYAQKGYNLEQSNPTTNTLPQSLSSRRRFDYLTIPINIGYTQHSNGQGVQVFAGGYIGFVLGGHHTEYGTYTDGNPPQSFSAPVVSANSSKAGLPIRSQDAGIQGGIGYRYQAILAQIEYSVGLKNVGPNNSSSSYSGDATYYNRVFQLSLAYLFGSKS